MSLPPQNPVPESLPQTRLVAVASTRSVQRHTAFSMLYSSALSPGPALRDGAFAEDVSGVVPPACRPLTIYTIDSLHVTVSTLAR